MAKKNAYRPFTPKPEMMALRPDVTGNSINGLGETSDRRPDRVYWAVDPDEIPFGEVQKWFYGQEPADDVLMAHRKNRRDILDAPLSPLNPQQTDQPPEAWTAALDQFIQTGDCEMVGVTGLRPEWVFSHQETEFGTVLMFGVQHNYEELKHVPETRGGIEVTWQYCRAAAVAINVASWLRENGWDAEPVTGPMVGKILMIPPALECGFGELGKHGSLINPEFGSAFCLGAVLTDAPFARTPKRSFGIDDFCTKCRICEDACPPIAIGPDKQLVRGEERWYVGFDTCIPFFAETSGCAICIAVCPWSRPGVGVNLAASYPNAQIVWMMLPKTTTLHRRHWPSRGSCLSVHRKG